MNNAYNDFRYGLFYEEIYKKHNLTEKELISILKRRIKGKYDYNRILSGGLEAQKQFNKHLNNLWNPLEHDAPWKAVSPYLNDKIRENEN